MGFLVGIHECMGYIFKKKKSLTLLKSFYLSFEKLEENNREMISTVFILRIPIIN